MKKQLVCVVDGALERANLKTLPAKLSIFTQPQRAQHTLVCRELTTLHYAGVRRHFGAHRVFQRLTG